MTKSIDLNADLGEDESPTGIARDIAIMDIVSSCNVACGGHAGSLATMSTMARAAKDKNVALGAHPSYPDRENFGRQSIDISIEDLAKALADQLTVMKTAARETGVIIQHLKPHGALYNDAQDDVALSQLLVAIAKAEQWTLVGMSRSVMQAKAIEQDVRFLCEGFIDRRYDQSARLVSRAEAGAVIGDNDGRLSQGLALAQARPVAAEDGSHVLIAAQTLCLHSDSDGALGTAKAMSDILQKNGFIIEAQH